MRSEPKLGQLITSEEKKDAIHVAICPVVANERIAPGQELGIVKIQKIPGQDDRIFVGAMGKSIGIADPFLKEMILPDETFYLVLFPYTVTSLRHEWTHPAFPKNTSPEVDQVILDYLLEKKAKKEVPETF